MMKILILLSILLILLQAYTGTARRYYARHRLEALARYQSLRRRTQNEQNTCSKWRQTCSPWSNSKNKCCDPSSLVCKCNLWMQNCRCVTRSGAAKLESCFCKTGRLYFEIITQQAFTQLSSLP